MTTDPKAIIADAEKEAAEAQALVATLEEAVKDGDESVTFDQVERARGLLSFVRLRQEAAARKATKAKEAARLEACEALNAEISALVKEDGKTFAKQLQTAVDAFRAFHDAVEARNAKVRDFRKRAEALDIPAHLHSGPASAKHGGVGIAANGGHVGSMAGVVVGRRRVDAIDADTFMNRALDLLRHEGKFKPNDNVNAGVDLFGDLAAIDAEMPESTAAHFYRGQGGGIIAKDDPFSAEEIQRLNLTVITKAQAEAQA